MSRSGDWNLAHREPWIVYFIFLVLTFESVFIIPAVSAETFTAEHISSYSYVTIPGKVVYQITIDDLPIGTNQTHTLVSNGNTFLLTINTWDDWGWKNADISITFPNGSTETKHVSTISFMPNYKTTIQPVYIQSYSLTMLGVYLQAGISPVEAKFDTQPISLVYNPQASTGLPFTSVSGNLGQSTTVWLEQMSEQDFVNHVTNYDPVYGIGNLGSQVFQWTWNAILGFVSMIPVIGPVMVNLINTMAGIISTGFFWLNFVVSNFPAILCGVETLILMMAVINAGKGKNTFSRLCRNVYQYNLAFILGCIGLANIVWSWTRSAVEMVATIVQALKPI